MLPIYVATFVARVVATYVASTFFAPHITLIITDSYDGYSVVATYVASVVAEDVALAAFGEESCDCPS